MPSGYDIDVWPVHVPLEPGEHVSSWLARLASRLEISPRAVLSAAAPDWSPVRDRHPSRWPLNRLAPGRGSRRVEYASIASAHLSTMQVAYDDYAHRYRRPAIPVTWQSKFCPECLHESDVWLASWAHPLHFICVEHGVSLVHRCGRCGQAPRAGVAWMSHVNRAARCPNRMPTTRGEGPRRRAPFCDADLRAALTRVVPRELAAQTWLLDHLRESTAPANDRTVVAGLQCAIPEVLDATFELVNEHLDGRNAHRVPNWRLVDALNLARRILTSSSVPEATKLADKHHLLSPTGTVTPIVMTQFTRARQHSPLLVAMRLGSLGDQLSVADQLMFRTASLRPCYPPASGDINGPASMGAARVPQLLWPGVMPEWQGVQARAALAIALAKVGSLCRCARSLSTSSYRPASPTTCTRGGDGWATTEVGSCATWTACTSRSSPLPHLSTTGTAAASDGTRTRSSACSAPRWRRRQPIRAGRGPRREGRTFAAGRRTVRERSRW